MKKPAKIKGTCRECRKYQQPTCCVRKQGGEVPAPGEWCNGWKEGKK
ncbi:MAG: hypothetical protein WC373_10780 [Smithella sp.]